MKILICVMWIQTFGAVIQFYTTCHCDIQLKACGTQYYVLLLLVLF